MAEPAIAQSHGNVIVNACAETLYQSVNIADIGRVVDISLTFHSLPNTYVATAGNAVAGLKAQGGVVVASYIESQRKKTDSGVLIAANVAVERYVAIGHIVDAFSVFVECIVPDGDVAAAGGVVKKGTSTDGRVIAAIAEVPADVVKKCERSNSGIA